MPQGLISSPSSSISILISIRRDSPMERILIMEVKPKLDRPSESVWFAVDAGMILMRYAALDAAMKRRSSSRAISEHAFLKAATSSRS